MAPKTNVVVQPKAEPKQTVKEVIEEKVEVSVAETKKVVVSGLTTNIRRKSTLSINDRKLRKEEEEEEKQKEALTGEARTDFSQAMLRNKWMQLARNLRKEGKESLYVTLTKHQPELEENFLVSFAIDSEVQLLELNELKADILSFIRQELQNFGVQLNFKMNKAQNVKKRETSKERYNKMVEKYPALDTLRKRFNMDLEYD